jgi:CheY-like chemotaxis protein/HPt (histidine-containing phosphotransfer) domain-containing protein
VGTILRNRGLTVSVAENGQVAVDKAMAAWRSGQPYDVILMDMQMPVLDGYGATMHLRDLGYRGPVVALTAHAMPGERERCYAAGCIDYLSKPVDRKALLATVARFLGPAKLGAPPPLVSSYANDPEMEELLQHFVRGLPGRITELRTAAGRPESDALLRLAHQLKGAAGGYGFAAISEAAGRLEQAVSAHDADTPALLDELLALCNRACTPELA